MRGVGVLLFLLWGTLGSVQAEPYSHSDDVATQPHTLLAHHLLMGNSLRYCITSFPYNNPLLSQQDAEILIKAALREWTHGIALQIRQAGREEEFKDIVAVLDKPLTLSAVEGCEALSQEKGDVSARDTQADIVFLISAKRCHERFKRTTSFYSAAMPNRVPFICLLETERENPLRAVSAQEYMPQSTSEKGRQILRTRRPLFETIAAGNYLAQAQQALWETNRFFAYDGPTLFATIVHELGHAFGLGDEYLSARPDTYSSKQAGTGIMQNLYQPISCDEVDGMITLLDRLSNTHRTFRSFCPNRGTIVDENE